MIDSFIEQLANTRLLPDSFNQYAHRQQSNLARRHNLHLYLSQMTELKPSVILVGEAPGYRGCRLTGIPFVSPHILENGDGVNLFGRGSSFLSIQEWSDIRKEASATIVWETLATVTAVPLLWNAYPFHPHQAGETQSNRTPTSREIELGRSFLTQLLQIFPIDTVIAVGNKADDALTRWCIPHDKVRHPARGGKLKFKQGLQKRLKSASQCRRGNRNDGLG